MGAEDSSVIEDFARTQTQNPMPRKVQAARESKSAKELLEDPWVRPGSV